MPQTLTQVELIRKGETFISTGTDEETYEEAANAIAAHLEDDACDNARFIRLEAKHGSPKKALERLIQETTAGYVAPDIYVTVRRPTVNGD